MANVFSRSWQITKLSFDVIKKDKEILLYPIFNIVVSAAFLIGMLYPTIIVEYLNEQSSEQIWGWMEYLLIFLTYLGLAVISTFFNVCIAYTAKTRFEGGNATLGSSLKFAFSKFHLIVLWGIVAAIANILITLLENLGGKGKTRASSAAARVAETAWRITTIFVVPILVYYDIKPFGAIKKSVQTLKKTWGESLIRYFGLGMMEFLFALLGIVIFGAIGYFVAPLGGTAILTVILLAVIYILILLLVFAAANQIFNTALFVYADQGRIPGGFTEEVMAQAFRPRRGAVAVA